MSVNNLSLTPPIFSNAQLDTDFIEIQQISEAWGVKTEFLKNLRELNRSFFNHFLKNYLKGPQPENDRSFNRIFAEYLSKEGFAWFLLGRNGESNLEYLRAHLEHWDQFIDLMIEYLQKNPISSFEHWLERRYNQPSQFRSSFCCQLLAKMPKTAAAFFIELHSEECPISMEDFTIRMSSEDLEIYQQALVLSFFEKLPKTNYEKIRFLKAHPLTFYIQYFVQHPEWSRKTENWGVCQELFRLAISMCISLPQDACTCFPELFKTIEVHIGDFRAPIFLARLQMASSSLVNVSLETLHFDPTEDMLRIPGVTGETLAKHLFFYIQTDQLISEELHDLVAMALFAEKYDMENLLTKCYDVFYNENTGRIPALSQQHVTHFVNLAAPTSNQNLRFYALGLIAIYRKYFTDVESQSLNKEAQELVAIVHSFEAGALQFCALKKFQITYHKYVSIKVIEKIHNLAPRVSFVNSWQSGYWTACHYFTSMHRHNPALTCLFNDSLKKDFEDYPKLIKAAEMDKSCCEVLIELYQLLPHEAINQAISADRCAALIEKTLHPSNLECLFRASINDPYGHLQMLCLKGIILFDRVLIQSLLNQFPHSLLQSTISLGLALNQLGFPLALDHRACKCRIYIDAQNHNHELPHLIAQLRNFLPEIELEFFSLNQNFVQEFIDWGLDPQLSLQLALYGAFIEKEKDLNGKFFDFIREFRNRAPRERGWEFPQTLAYYTIVSEFWKKNFWNISLPQNDSPFVAEMILFFYEKFSEDSKKQFIETSALHLNQDANHDYIHNWVKQLGFDTTISRPMYTELLAHMPVVLAQLNAITPASSPTQRGLTLCSYICLAVKGALKKSRPELIDD